MRKKSNPVADCNVQFLAVPFQERGMYLFDIESIHYAFFVFSWEINR